MDGKTRVCRLIASPVKHSMSPMMHNFFAQRTGVNLTYVPFKVEGDRVGDTVKGVYTLNILGMNVTVPHEQRVMEFLFGLDEDARTIRAVNTLVRTETGHKGYNTDGVGLKQAFAEAGIRTEGGHCLLIRVGGATEATAYVLAKGGAARIHILNRNEARARELAGYINILTGRGLAEALPLEGYRSLPARKGGYLAIRFTSVDMHPRVEDVIIDNPRFYEMIYTGVDIVYTPARIRFMKMVQEAGGRAVNGLDMLLYQGVIAYEFWSPQIGVDSETIELAKQMTEDYLQKKQAGEGRGDNLILIGFVGAGKSRVGEHFVARYRMPVIDTDREIEAAAGMAISNIFATQGEEAFRRLETGILEKLLEQGGRSMISVGGGLPLREGNRALLKQLEAVVYLGVLPKTVIERIGSDVSDRPILHGSGVMGCIVSLLESGRLHYPEASHIIVDVNGRDVDSIVEEIYCRATDKTC